VRGLTIIVATILSTVIHFFVLTLLDTIPLVSKEFSRRPELYMVDLVPLEPERAAPQEEAAEVKKEEVKKEEAKKEEVKKEEPKQEEVTREPKKEEPKKEEKKEDKVVLADRGKEQEKKEKTKKQAPNPEQQLSTRIKELEQKVAARGKGDSPAPEATDDEINKYKATIQDRVKRFWVIPDTLSSEKDLKAVIIIEIDQQGQVKGSRFEQSSGNLSFDQSAMRAINKAAPFPPPPGQMPEIGLIFEPRER
jgi:colicin import membrane protein